MLIREDNHMYQIRQNSSEFPVKFQQESLELVNCLLPLTSSAFYLVDPDMRHKEVILRGIRQETDQAYRSHYKNIDPAHPSRLQSNELNLQCLSRSMSTTELHNSAFYKEFLKPINIEDAVDIFFRYDDKVIAVLTMLRDASLPKFSNSELHTLQAIQRFLEYTVTSLYIPEHISRRKHISQKYKLTDRELDVLEWIIAGEKNETIAKELWVSLATVKTHLHHIYTKMKVTSRTKLLSKVFSEIGR